MVLFDRRSSAQQPHRPPPPNPFLTPPALQRLRADIDLVNPAIDLSLQCLPYSGRPPPPNPFLTPPALQRLRADIDLVNPAIDLSPQYLPYSVGDHSDGYDEKLAKSEHQVHTPSKIAPSDLRGGESPYRTTLSSSKPSYDEYRGLNEAQIADEEAVFSSQSHHSSGRTHDAAGDYSKAALFSYEGYTLAREEVENVSRKRTWAYCRRDPMDVSQEYLKERLSNERRGLVLNQYNSPEMNGYKRCQVDRLLHDQNAKEKINESGYEYGLASVKLQGQVEDGHVTPTRIDVILQRRPCPDMRPWLSAERVPPISFSRVIDLLGRSESEIAQDQFSGREFASTPEATIPPVDDSIPRASITHEPTHDSIYDRYRDESQEAEETQSLREDTPEPDLTFEEIYGPRRPANSTDPPYHRRRRRSSELEDSIIMGLLMEM